MSEPQNVTELYPERSRRRRFRRRLFSLLGVLLVVLLVVGLILFRKELNLDRLRRYVTYLTVRDSGDYGVYSFDAHSSNAYCAYEDGLAVASVAGLSLYGPSGEELASVSRPISVPAMAVGDELVLAWDAGGTRICAAGSRDGTVLDRETEKVILDADISNGDQICYATAAEGYRTVLTVLNDRQEEVYQWFSSSQYLPLCAISDGGDRLAAISVGQANGAFASRLQLFETDQEDPGPSAALGSQLIYDLDFLSDKCICTIGETSLQFFDGEAELLGEYSYDGYLRGYDLSGGGFAALSVNRYRAGSHCSVVTVGGDGQVLGEAYLGEEILSVSAAGSYVAVLTAGHLRIYTSDLQLYDETQEAGGATRVLMRTDGTALLVGNGSANLYLPS